MAKQHAKDRTGTGPEVNGSDGRDRSADDAPPPGRATSHPPMVSVVAPSGTGKTSLIEKVITDLTGAGYRVAAVKHDAHRIELDTEGKDSWRFREAGATSTALVGRNQLAWFADQAEMPPLERVAALLFPDVDLVLVEGFRSAGLPAIVVVRPDRPDQGPSRWDPPDPELVLATVGPGEVDAVVELLVGRYLTGDR